MFQTPNSCLVHYDYFTKALDYNSIYMCVKSKPKSIFYIDNLLVIFFVSLYVAQY